MSGFLAAVAVADSAEEENTCVICAHEITQRAQIVCGCNVCQPCHDQYVAMKLRQGAPEVLCCLCQVVLPVQAPQAPQEPSELQEPPGWHNTEHAGSTPVGSPVGSPRRDSPVVIIEIDGSPRRVGSPAHDEEPDRYWEAPDYAPTEDDLPPPPQPGEPGYALPRMSTGYSPTSPAPSPPRIWPTPMYNPPPPPPPPLPEIQALRDEVDRLKREMEDNQANLDSRRRINARTFAANRALQRQLESERRANERQLESERRAKRSLEVQHEETKAELEEFKKRQRVLEHRVEAANNVCKYCPHEGDITTFCTMLQNALNAHPPTPTNP